jgi:hypothetical protein
MSFSFPYPQLGRVVRPIGKGCTSCVHQLYCPAVYWFRRYTFKDMELPNGRACLSWSENPSDRLTFANPTQDDLDENDYMYIEGIGSEANRSGIGETTGGSRQSEGA